MFDFIKNLFKKEQKKETLGINHVAAWFDEQIKPLVESENKNIQYIFNEFNIILNNFNQGIEELQKAEIKDSERIEDRIKQVVLGNRELYIKRLKQFMQFLNMPDEANHLSAVSFYTKLEKELEEFSKSTVKTYYTVQHLFADPLDKIARNIKRVDDLIKEIKELTNNENLLKIEKLKKEIHALIYSKQKKEQFTLNLDEEKSKAQKLERERLQIQSSIEELQKSSEYNDYLLMKERIESLERDINNEKNEIINLFYPLSASLKKFKRLVLEDDALIEKYSEDPVSALIADKELKIIDILQKMEKSIYSDALEIKDDKKTKIIDRINLIQNDRLNQLASRYNALKSEKELMLRKIKVNKIWLKNDELKYKLEHVENSMKIYNELIEDLNKKINEIDLIKQKENLENNIKEITNVEISIVIA